MPDKVGATLVNKATIDAILAVNGCTVETNQNRKVARERSLAIRFIRGTNSTFAGYL